MAFRQHEACPARRDPRCGGRSDSGTAKGRAPADGPLICHSAAGFHHTCIHYAEGLVPESITSAVSATPTTVRLLGVA